MKVKNDTKFDTVKALWMHGNEIIFIDQRKLPGKLEYFVSKDLEQTAYAISDMVVRGAPAIGVAAAFGVAQAVKNGHDIDKAIKVLGATRPTAYDLFFALDYMKNRIEEGITPDMAAISYNDYIVEKCKKIGEYGNSLIKDGYSILTHCNAGALATVDYGTALAPMRVAHENGKAIFVWVDETRPRLQGARLTSWELYNEGISHAVIADNASGYYMLNGDVDMVIVGADRITAGGDFANKIGTYEKAVVAHENGIPFYVAAPVSTIDFSIVSYLDIPIEERSENEVHYIGSERITPEGVKARNPAFDVTPGKYVTGFITEKGIIKPENIVKLKGSLSDSS